MTILFVNNWEAALTDELNSNETSVIIEPGPYSMLENIQEDEYYPALLFNGSNYEYVHIISKDGSDTISIERGKEGSAAIVCRTGDKISIVNSAKVYQNMNQKESAIQINKKTITADTIIPDGYNAISVGPLDINATVTINDSTWEIL